MKKALLWCMPILIPCLTLLGLGILATIISLAVLFGSFFFSFKLISFLIPINKIKKEKKQVEKTTKFDQDLIKYKTALSVVK